MSTEYLDKLAQLCGIQSYESWEEATHKIFKHIQSLNVKVEELEFKRDKYLPLVDRELDILEQLSIKNMEKFAENRRGLTTEQIKQVEVLLKIRTLIQDKPVKIIREIIDARAPTTLSNEEILRQLQTPESEDASN